MKSSITKFVLITVLSFIGYALKLNAQCNNNTCGTTNNSTSTAFNSGNAAGISSFVVGPMSVSNSLDASIIGTRSEISTSADHSHIFGSHNFIYDGSSKAFIFGYDNIINSNSVNAIAIGFGNNTGGNNGYNISIGHQNTTNAEMTLALGEDNILNGEYSAALGLGLQTSPSAHHSIALGFGTSTFEPYSLAFAAGSTTPAIYVKGNDTPSYVGFVGICNKTPKAELDVLGDIRITGENTSLLFGKMQESIQEQWGLRNKDGAFVIFEPSTEINPGKAPEVEKIRLYIEDETGNIGINTIQPQHQLSVDGNIMVSSDNGSLLFTDDPLDPEATWGKWGIEYHNGGLNFWRPFQGSGGAGKGGDNTDNTLNYALFISDEEGKIGVGTELPETQLHVNGDLRVTDLANLNLSTIDRITLADGKGNLKTSESLLINNNGAIGIGLDPLDHFEDFTGEWDQYKLYVNGGVMSTEIWVKLTTNWSDFVFEDNYKLRPLSEVEQFINDKGHLPEIPSAEQVAEEGINVGQMDAKLLQKIEELTLYVIEQQKQIEKQQQQINSLLKAQQ